MAKSSPTSRAPEGIPTGPPSAGTRARLEVPVWAGGIVASKYRIDAVNGFGGMGIVCEAFHLDLQTKVEVQIARREHVNDERAVARILSEARSAAQLRSQHARRVLDCGRLDVGAPYMVVEHLDGADLRRVLTAHGRLPVEEAMSFVSQACDALGEAHARGIVHGDLKPEHLFLTQGADGGALIKVLDLGVSKQIERSRYTSPEQTIDPAAVDARTDVWSLGVLLHELLTGKVARSLGEVNVGIPDSLAAILLRCMDKKRELRYPDATALGRALRAFGGTASLTAERVEEILGRARSAQSESATSQSVAGMPPSVIDMPPSVVEVPPSVIDMPPSVVDVPPSVANQRDSAADEPNSAAEQRDSVIEMPASVIDVPDSVAPPPVSSSPAMPALPPPPLPRSASPSESTALRSQPAPGSIADFPQSEPAASRSIPAAVQSVPAASQSVPAKRPSLATKPPPLPPSQSPPAPILNRLLEKHGARLALVRGLLEKPGVRFVLAGGVLGLLVGLFAPHRADPASEPSSSASPSMGAHAVESAPRAVVDPAPPIAEPAPTEIDLDQPAPPTSAAPVVSVVPPPPAPAQDPSPEPPRKPTASKKAASSTTPSTTATAASASRPTKRAWMFPELKQPVLPPNVR